MKNHKIICYWCKTENEITTKNFSRVVSCRHCQKKMILAKSEFKKLKLIRYMMVLIISLAFMYVCSLINYAKGNNYLAYLPLIIFVSLMLFFAGEADKFTYKMLFWLSKDLKYEEYIPDPKTRKNAPKKKGWLSRWIFKKD